MDNTKNKTNGENKMSSKTKITLGAMSDGNFSTGDSRGADVFLNGAFIGCLDVDANCRVSEGVLSFSGDRFVASDLSVTIYPERFGIVGLVDENGAAVEWLDHAIEIITSYGGRLMTAAEAKREARQWVADTVKSLRAEAGKA